MSSKTYSLAKSESEGRLCTLPGKDEETGAPNENIVQNHLNIELLNVF